MSPFKSYGSFHNFAQQSKSREVERLGTYLVPFWVSKVTAVEDRLLRRPQPK